MRRRPHYETLETRMLLASDWQNPARQLDVNNDGSLTPLDALLGINRLNSVVSGPLPLRAANSDEPYYDTNGDGIHSPIDVLLVINTLNGGLQITSSLKIDSGSGTGANGDRVTSDPTITGSVLGNADVLKVRMGEGPWLNVSGSLRNNGSFEIAETVLEQLAGGPLADGLYRVGVEAGYSNSSSTLVDRAFVDFELDKTSPNSRVIGEIFLGTSNQIVIPFDEPLSAASIDLSQVALYDITWGEKSEDSRWDLNGNHPRFPIQPVSIQLSDDRRGLVITTPDVGRSAKYLVELRNAVEDKAGNPFKGQLSDSVWSVMAHRFSAIVPTLSFGTVYRNLIENEARILEYRFTLPTNETILWSGSVDLGALSVYELYDQYGNRLLRYLPGTVQEPGDAQRPALLPLLAGEYRLRVVDLPVGSGQFALYRTNELPEMPALRPSGNTGFWPLDAYAINLDRKDRLYAEAVEQKPVLRWVMDPLGEPIQLSSQGQHQFFDTQTPGKHIVLVNRVGYRSYPTSLDLESIADISGPITGTLATPGQVKHLSIKVTSGEIYLMDRQLANAVSMTFEFRGSQFSQLSDSQYLIRPKSGRLELGLEHLGAQVDDAHYDLRLTRLSDAPQLPMNEWLDAPANGTHQIYRLSDLGRVMFSGQREFKRVFLRDGQITVVPELMPTIASEPTELTGSSFIIVPGTLNQSRWRAITPMMFSQQLDFNASHPLHFESGLETFEFVFEGVAGEFIAGHLTADRGSTAFNLSPSGLKLLGATGQVVPMVGSRPDQNVWQIGQPGTYRMVVTGQGIFALGDTNLHATRSSTWQTLPTDQLQRVAPNSRQFYAIPSNLDSLFLAANNFDRPSTKWRIFDQTGKTLFEVGVHVINIEDSWIELPGDASYFLEVDNRRWAAPFEFRRTDATTTSHRVELGIAFSGQLLKRGDRVRLEYELIRGQRVDWESLTFDGIVVGVQQINPDLRSERPQDGFWLVPDSGVYTLELSNKSDEPQNFEVKLIASDQPPLGRGIRGFENRYEGLLTRTETNEGTAVFPFEIATGTAFFVDWLISRGNDDLYYSIIGPENDPVLFQSYIFDSPLLVLPTAGQYRVAIQLRDGIDAAFYDFVLRDLAAAPRLEPGSQIDGDVLGPYESRLYRMEFAHPADMELVQPSVSLVDVSAETLYPGTSSKSNGLDALVTYAAGPIAIRASSNNSEQDSVSFSTRVTEHRTRLTLDRSHRVLLTSGMTPFQFQSVIPNSIVVIASSTIGVSFRLFDKTGSEVMQNATGGFTLSTAGSYRLEVITPAGTSTHMTTLAIESIPKEPLPYTIGDVVVTPALEGERVQYAFNVPANGVYLGRTEGSVSLELFYSTGQSVTLGPVGSLRSFHYLEVGHYVAQVIVGKGNTLKFSVEPIEGLDQVDMGTHTGQLNVNESDRIWRYIATEDQAIVLTASGGVSTSYSYFVDGMSTPRGLSGSVLIRLKQGQNLFVNFDANSPGAGAGGQYEFSISAVPSVKKLALSVDSQINGDLEAWRELSVSFTLGDSHTALYIHADMVGARLELPNGEIRGLHIAQFGSVLFNQAAGDYKLLAPASAVPRGFRISISSFQSAPQLDLPFDGVVTGNRLYQLNVPESAQHHFSLVDSSGNETNAYQIWNEFGLPVSMGSRASLPQGRFWIAVLGSSKLTFNLAPIIVQQSMSDFGEQLSIQTTNTTDAIVQFSTAAGALLDLTMVDVPIGINSQFRIVPASVNTSRERGWVNLDEWTAPRFVNQDSMVEFRFSGAGSSAMKLVDLRIAPQLVFGQSIDESHLAHHRRTAWKIQPEASQTYVVTYLKAEPSSARWKIVNSAGTDVAIITEGDTLSFGKDESFYLVLETSSVSRLDTQAQILISPLN